MLLFSTTCLWSTGSKQIAGNDFSVLPTVRASSGGVTLRRMFCRTQPIKTSAEATHVLSRHSRRLMQISCRRSQARFWGRLESRPLRWLHSFPALIEIITSIIEMLGGRTDIGAEQAILSGPAPSRCLNPPTFFGGLCVALRASLKAGAVTTNSKFARPSSRNRL